MRRSRLTRIAIAFLVLALVVPTTALAARDGHGKGRGAASDTRLRRGGDSQRDGTDRELGGKKRGADQAAKLERKAQRAAVKQQKRAARMSAGQTAESSEAVEPTGSVEASPATAPTRLRGIANALSHIQLNIARFQARIDAGVKASLPQGLVGVMQKFMSWLGLSPTTTPGAEATGTVEPTATVEPTGTVEPTTTVEPTGTVDTTTSN